MIDHVNSNAKQFVDVSVYHSRYPFRRLPLDNPQGLAEALQQRGITEAWVGNFDALLHRDMAAVNESTAEVCRRFANKGWRAVGCVNPKLPDWQDDLRRVHEQYGMLGVRLHPNYHGYSLDDPNCVELLRAAANRRLLVQVAISMEDPRTQHSRVQVGSTDHRPLKNILLEIPNLRVMLLNLFYSTTVSAAAAIAVPGRTWFDIANLEGLEGVAKLVAATQVDSVVYGSYSPYFYQDSAYLKLTESGLPESTLDRIRAANATAAGNSK